MAAQRGDRRLLIYSHDSFGLGHLRRCRAIAHDLVDRYKHLSVLILSGSPIIGSFDFKARVDFVRVPGVIKLRNGEYTSLGLHIDIEQTLAMRSSIMRHTAEIFAPDLFLVDKEPLGLRGEVRSTLELLRARGTRCVLGLRDVMDEPASLVKEWRRKGVFPVIDRLFDELWVYGRREIFDPTVEIPGFADLAAKLRFTGYLRRTSPGRAANVVQDWSEEPFILVTTGGGGDGEELIDWVISAYEQDPGIPYRALILLGPFMHLDQRAAFHERVQRLPRLRALTFEAQVETLFERAAGVVAMGGYNTFCEILSFRKPAVIVPRTVPRREQFLRAERAQRLGLLQMLPDDGQRDPRRMAAMLRQLPLWPRVDVGQQAHLLNGHDRICELVEPWLGPASATARRRRAARA